MNYAQGLYHWKWFIKPATLEAERMGFSFCPVYPTNHVKG